MKRFIKLFLMLIFLAQPAFSNISKETPKPPTVKEEAAPIKPQNTNETQTEAVKTVQNDEVNELREQARFLYNSNELSESMAIYAKISDNQKNSEDWMFLANIAQDGGKAVDAVFYLKKAIQIDDKNYKAHYNLGNIYFSDNKVNMALAEYKKATKLKSDFSYAYYNMGCCYLKKKVYFNAKYMFGLAIKANPEEPSFYYNLAYTYKLQKKHKKAKEALDIYNKIMTQ